MLFVKNTTNMWMFLLTVVVIIEHGVSACHPCSCFPTYNNSLVADCKNISSLDSMDAICKNSITILILRDTHITALPTDICEWNQLAVVIEVRNPYLPCNETERVVYYDGFVESDKCTYHTISPHLPIPLQPSAMPGKTSIPFQVYCCILFIFTCVIIFNKYLSFKKKSHFPLPKDILEVNSCFEYLSE